MVLYTCYTGFFLFLLLTKKGLTKAFCFNENETRYILIGLIIYCSGYLLSSTLIEFDLKSESYRIFNHHAILLPICVVLFIKMNKQNDP